MSRRRRLSVIISDNREGHMFGRQARPKIINIASGTWSGSTQTCTEGGVFCIAATTAGLSTGTAFVSLDTAGTGTQIYT